MIKLILANSILYGVLFLFNYFVGLVVEWNIMYLFFLVLSLILFQIRFFVRKVKDVLPMHLYMISAGIKFLTCGLFALYMLQVGVSNLEMFIILMMMMYLFHLLFELNILLTNLRLQNKGTRN